MKYNLIYCNILSVPSQFSNTSYSAKVLKHRPDNVYYRQLHARLSISLSSKSDRMFVTLFAVCAPDCNDQWIGDSYCDIGCNITACGYDNGDCESSAFVKNVYPAH